MQAVDAVVHPSVDPEPFGRTLVEAMLAGVPVIATDAGASAEILDGGAAGTLVPPRQSDRLAVALAALRATRAPSRRAPIWPGNAPSPATAQTGCSATSTFSSSKSPAAPDGPAPTLPIGVVRAAMPRVLVNMPSQHAGRPSGVALVAFRVIAGLVERGTFSVVLRSPWTRDQLPPAIRDRIEVLTVPRPRIMLLDVLRQAFDRPDDCAGRGTSTSC